MERARTAARWAVVASLALAEIGGHPRSRFTFFVINGTFRLFFLGLNPGDASGRLLGEGTPSSVWGRDSALRPWLRRNSGSGISSTGPVSRRAVKPLSHQAGEPPSPQDQENEPASSTLTLRTLPDALRACGVPTLPCAAFRLLSSPAHSRAWPFAVAKAKATQVCTRNRTSPVAADEPPSSRDPTTTRPLRRSPRHP